MNFKILIANIKLILFVKLIILIVWFYKDYQYQKTENTRQSENASQLRKSDSLRFSSQILTQREMADYLQYQNSDLANKLKSDNINYKRIQSIVSQKLDYKDTVLQQTDVSEIIKAVQNKINIVVPFIDSTKCLQIKGFLKYEKDSLKIKVTERIFKNKTDAVAYWQRRQWKFLGIKTRFLGKKEFTAVNYNNCGETYTMKIEKKK